MQHSSNTALTRLKSAWRFRWHGVITAWVTCIIGWAAVLAIPNPLVPEALHEVNEVPESAEQRAHAQAEVERLDTAIAAATESLEQFRLDNTNQLADVRVENLVRLETITLALENTQAELRAATEQRELLLRNSDGASPLFGPVPVSEAELDRRIAEYRRGLDVLRRKYSEDHLEVVEVRELLDRMLERKNWKTNKEAELAAIDARIAELEGVRNDYQTRISDTQELLNEAPAVESKLAQLTNDLDTLQARYLEAVAHLADIEQQHAAEQQRRQEQQQAPHPATTVLAALPARHVLLAVVLVVGMIIGTTVAIVASSMRPVFLDTTSIRVETGLPVLGDVPAFASAMEKKKTYREAAAFVLAIVLLCALFGLVYL